MSKKSLIDSIEVKSPCSQNWNEMKGTDNVRFCGHCASEVNNISALTRKQAMRLVRESNGGICVHYVKNPVDNKPLFADKLYKITRRAGITAGVLGASLALSTLAYAQGEPVLQKKSVARIENLKQQELEKDKTGDATANVSGKVTDPTNTGISSAFINIMNETTNELFSVRADENGFYELKNLLAGTYKMTVTAGPGFDIKVLSVEVYAENNSKQDISLGVIEEAIVTINADNEIYETTTSGSMVSISYRSQLFTAVSNDNLEEVKNLIARGENVNLKDENYSNITPLFLAVENGNAEIAETLLNFGAKVNVKDSNKQTPLMRLDEDASPELVNLLINHGAKINLTDKDDNNALILSSRSARPEVLRILTNYISNINAQNSEGRTALMEAADADNLENVRALLGSGANVNLQDKAFESAISLTTDEDIEKLLTDYGAAVK